MREPGFAAAWAMPAWSAAVAFTDGKPAPDSLTGQLVQEHGDAADPQAFPMTVGPTFAEGRTRYYGIPRNGIPTKMYDDPASAIADEGYSNMLWDALSFFNRDLPIGIAIDKFDRETTQHGMGLLEPDVNHDLPIGVSLYSRLLKGSPHVLVMHDGEFLDRIPGETYQDIEVQLNTLLVAKGIKTADGIAPQR